MMQNDLIAKLRMPQAASERLQQAVMRTVEDITQVLQEESACIMQASHGAFSTLTDRKIQLSMELARQLEHLTLGEATPELRRTLTALKVALEGNAKHLNRHIRAVATVASIVSQAITQSETDGLYTRGTARREARP